MSEIQGATVAAIRASGDKSAFPNPVRIAGQLSLRRATRRGSVDPPLSPRVSLSPPRLYPRGSIPASLSPRLYPCVSLLVSLSQHLFPPFTSRSKIDKYVSPTQRPLRLASTPISAFSLRDAFPVDHERNTLDDMVRRDAESVLSGFVSITSHPRYSLCDSYKSGIRVLYTWCSNFRSKLLRGKPWGLESHLPPGSYAVLRPSSRISEWTILFLLSGFILLRVPSSMTAVDEPPPWLAGSQLDHSDRV